MKYKLKDIFDLQMGKTPSRNNSEYWNTEDYKWISIADLSKNGMYILDTKEYLSEKAILESGIKVIPANTVVMSFKLSIGKTAITAEDMYSNEAIMSFHDKHIVELLPEYIFYMFKYKNWDEDSNKAVMGKTLNKAILSETVIEICSIEKQKEIVNILNKMTCIIEKRQQELSELDTLIKARFVEMFGDIITNEKNWSTDKWGNVLKIINGKNQRNIESEYGEFLICGSGGPMGRGTDYLTKENSVIIGRKGNINKPILMREKYWNVDTAFGIEPNEEHINVEYLYMFCNFFNFEILNKAVTIPSLTKSDLLNIEIPIPDMVIQKQFTNFVQQIDKLRFGGRKRLTKAKNTKNNNRNTITLERSTLYGK